ncbi:hypothetical protein [Reichenbachiella sp.]|uniref:hypothetical protein n=1 Tax=Reichenbachiella sp. TaxID=2184521 RepID=UPI003BB1549B
MPIPTHDTHCVSKAYRTNCPDCSRSVWFFSCNCGSKVFFDQLGIPWPQHSCRERNLRELLETLREVERLNDQEIYQRIDEIIARNEVEIPDEISDILDNYLGGRKGKLTIIEVTDLDKLTDIDGQVIEFNRVVSFKSRLKLDMGNAIVVAMAGELLKHEFGELIIRSNPNRKNEVFQYSVLVKKSYLKTNPIKKGDFLLAAIKEVSNKLGNFWEIDAHKIY